MFCQFSKIQYYLLQKHEKVINEDNKIDERTEYLNKSTPHLCTNNKEIKNLLTAKGNTIYLVLKLLQPMLAVQLMTLKMKQDL